MQILIILQNCIKIILFTVKYFLLFSKDCCNNALLRKDQDFLLEKIFLFRYKRISQNL
jgi:hypothetical protein